MPKNVGDLGKFIVAKGFKKLPKVQKIAQSGHTGYDSRPIVANPIGRYLTENTLVQQPLDPSVPSSYLDAHTFC